MFCVRVAPLSHGGRYDELTYFSATAFPEGAIIRAPFRTRDIQVLVLSCTPVAHTKSILRSADFTTRKLPSQEVSACIPHAHLLALTETARLQCIRDGVLFSTLFSHLVLETASTNTKKTEPCKDTRPIFFLEGAQRERVSFYRSLARTELARGYSTLLVAPTGEEAVRIASLLKEEHPVLLHTHMRAKKKTLARAREDTPTIFIVSPSFAPLPRHDIRTIIIECEHASSYTRIRPPLIDIRVFLTSLVKHTGASFFVGDAFLRHTHVAQVAQGKGCGISLLSPTPSLPHTHLIDRTQETKTSEWRTIGDTLFKEIQATLAQEKNIFLHTVRKGFAPLTVCADCGSSVLCPACASPLLLRAGEGGKHVYTCRCGTRLSANISCPSCKGWRLVALGVGIDRVVNELQERFPETSVFVLSRDTASTHLRAEKIVREWNDAKGSILVGTDFALPFFETAPLLASISLDTLLSLPEWNAHERTAHTLAHLRDHAEKTFLVQTQHPSPVFDAVFSFDRRGFDETERTLRARFGYPPYGTLVRIWFQTPILEYEKQKEHLVQTLTPHQIRFSTPERKNSETLVGIGTLLTPMLDDTLAHLLTDLPPHYVVRIEN
jgi:primosomal protein N'